MGNILKKKKNVKYIILFVISICYLLLYLKPSVVDFDENYTLTLISHSYSKIIYLDSMDVHPPLYYFLVKLFVQITTFWTTYFPFKILAARLFSIIISIISFVFLRKLTAYFHIINNVVVQWILLLLIPNALGIKFQFQQLVDIRMYSLAALFIIIEFYYLIKFYNTTNYKYFLVITLCAISASYTHYYAAVFAGLLLLFYCIRSFFKNYRIKSLLLFISGFILCVSFLPWLPIVIKQMTRPKTYWITLELELKDVFILFALIIIFYVPLFIFFKYDNKYLCHLNILLFDLLLTFIIFFIYGLLSHPVFQVRYMYPVLLISEFLGMNVIIKFIHVKGYKHYCSLLILSLLSLNALVSGVYQAYNIKKYSINSIRLYNKWNNKNEYIHIYHFPNNYYKSNYYISDMSTTHNKFIVTNSFKRHCSIYNNNAYKYVFKDMVNKTSN